MVPSLTLIPPALAVYKMVPSLMLIPTALAAYKTAPHTALAAPPLTLIPTALVAEKTVLALTLIPAALAAYKMVPRLTLIPTALAVYKTEYGASRKFLYWSKTHYISFFLCKPFVCNFVTGCPPALGLGNKPTQSEKVWKQQLFTLRKNVSLGARKHRFWGRASPASGFNQNRSNCRLSL